MIDINPSQLLSPLPENTDVVTFSIKVDDQLISDQYTVLNLSVDFRFNRITHARLRVLDSDVSAQRLEVSDQDVLSPGNKIEIAVGYYSQETVIFEGMIIKHCVKIKNSGTPEIEIECKDLAVKLTVGRKNNFFFNQSDSDIIQEMAQSYDLEPDIDDTRVNHQQMVQYYSTDWDFLVSRADANAALVLTQNGKLVVKPPKFDQRPKFVLNYGSSIYEFEAEMDARNQYPAAKVTAWDPSQQKIIEAEANESGASISGGIGGAFSAISSAASGNLINDLLGSNANTDYTEVIGIDNFACQHTGNFTNEELQNWAVAQFQKSTLSKTKGLIRFDGVPDIFPGDVIELQNVGVRHTGSVFVTSVRQEVYAGAWYTTVQFGMPHCWFVREFEDVQELSASSLLPGVCGLQIGVITAIHNDPDKQDRVQVRLPLIESKGDGIWARVSSQDAGENRGSFFRPEVDDEVIVGFLNDDPRHPVIMGMLNSSKKPAAITATKENHEKGWVTRSGMRMIFHDEEKSLNIETPDGKKLMINDQDDAIQLEDQHGNKILMDSNGISIESSSDLTLKASKDVKVEGMNIEHSANQEFSAQGQSKSKLISVGDVVVTGTFVKINS